MNYSLHSRPQRAFRAVDMVKIFTVLIFGNFMIIMCLAIYFKAYQNHSLMLLYPPIVAFCGWIGVAYRSRLMLLPLYFSLMFEMMMGLGRLSYIDRITDNRQLLEGNDPLSEYKDIADFYPAFAAEVQQHLLSSALFKTREYLLFLYEAVLYCFMIREVVLINRERYEENYNEDVVGAEMPDLPPPSYEFVCADHTAYPIVVCETTSHTELPPSYEEVMMRRKEGGHSHHHPQPPQENCPHIQKVPSSHSILSVPSCSTGRFSAPAVDFSVPSTARSTSSCSLRRMPSCATPSVYENGDFEAPTPLEKWN